jgi:hypothetical protein
MKFKFLILFLIFTSGCSIWGPNPKENHYQYSIRTIPECNNIVYILHGILWPNVSVDDTLFSLPKGVNGVLFVTDNKIIFAVYDKTVLTYYSQVIFNFADFAAASLRKNLLGVRKIIQFQTLDGKINSFGIIDSFTSDGDDADENAGVAYILDKINKKL